MEYEAAVSLQISGFDINLRFNIPVCQNPVSLECLAHHGILLPVARQAYLGGIFIGYPEQSRFQIKGNTLTGKKLLRLPFNERSSGVPIVTPFTLSISHILSAICRASSRS